MESEKERQQLFVNSTHAQSETNSYDEVAHDFANWKWSRFWAKSERPLVEEWLRTNVKRGSHVVDAGSGLSPYSRLILSLGIRLTCVDSSEKMLSESRRRLGKDQHLFSQFIKADLSYVPLRTNEVDAIICNRVLSHISTPGRVFSEFSRLIKQGGPVLITDIHPDHDYTSTRIEVGGRVVRIQVVKHPIERLHTDLVNSGFGDIRINSYSFTDLVQLAGIELTPFSDSISSFKPLLFKIQATKS